MKLYKVRVEWETVIQAESQLEAEDQAEWVIKSGDDPSDLITVEEITKISDLPTGWKGNCIPWGHPYSFRTIEEILKEK